MQPRQWSELAKYRATVGQIWSVVDMGSFASSKKETEIEILMSSKLYTVIQGHVPIRNDMLKQDHGPLRALLSWDRRF
jgi:hypothetical protein